MILEANGIIYIVHETPTDWKLITSVGGIGVSVVLSKEDFSNFEVVQDFVKGEF